MPISIDSTWNKINGLISASHNTYTVWEWHYWGPVSFLNLSCSELSHTAASYFAPLWKKVWLKSLFDCVPFVCYYDPVGVPRAWMCACSGVLLEQAKLLATNGHDELGIKATQHPTGKSNSSALHHPTQPHSLFYPMHSHYSPFHPSLLTFLTLHPFRSPTPPPFFPRHPPPHIFTSPLSSTLLTVFSPSMWMVTHISIFGLATSSLQSSFLPQRQEIFSRYCAPYLPGT